MIPALQQTTSAEATTALGRDLASCLTVGDVVLLTGDLGAGKTTFVQGLATGLGVEEHVQSPTFTIIAEYPAILHDLPVTLAHLDLYRLEPGGSMRSAGIDDLIDRDDVIAVIEWPDRLEETPPGRIWRISISHLGGNTRSIRVEEPADV